MTTAINLSSLNTPPQTTQDNLNSSIEPYHYVHYNQKELHHSSNTLIENQSIPYQSKIHLLQNNNPDDLDSCDHKNQSSHLPSNQTTPSFTNHNSYKLNPYQNPLDDNFKAKLFNENFNPISTNPNHVISTINLPIKPNHPLTQSSIINHNNDIQTIINPSISNFSPDLTIEEDAPHEEDNSDTENELTYVHLPITTEDTYSINDIKSNTPSRHNSINSIPFHDGFTNQTHSPQTENQFDVKPPNTQRKPKPNSKKSSRSIKTPSCSETTCTKQPPRIKSAEQLATEALIEQQNPNATKNELRSLKLRALHAVRIAQRELNMPEAEKQRRLRLREYVRQKRAEERIQKNSNVKRDTQCYKINSSSTPHSTSSLEIHDHKKQKIQRFNLKEFSSQDSNPTTLQTVDEFNLVNQYNQSKSNHLYHFNTLPSSQSSHPSTSNSITSNLPLDNVDPMDSIQKINQTHSDSNPISSTLKTSQDGQIKKTKQKIPYQRKVLMTPLELEIQRQNPNASPNKIKSLKLRALHAKRIEERERNMSEKEKLRRHKLRVYMRHRRDEARTKNLDEIEKPIQVRLQSGSHLTNQESFNCSQNEPHQSHANQELISNLGYPDLIGKEIETEDHTQNNSSIEMSQNDHDQYQQFYHVRSHPLDSLFQAPMTSSTLLDMKSTYDYSAQTVSDPWSQITEQDVNKNSNELDQKELHAALQEAIYMTPHPGHSLDSHGQYQEQFITHRESIQANKIDEMEYEGVGVVGNDLLTIVREREISLNNNTPCTQNAHQIQHAPSSHIYSNRL